MSHIDVMVPCYNYGRFLRQCVGSVLSQSHRDLRVVIIDDASTDDTQAVCGALMEQDARVEVLRHPVNLGHIATYNECIDLARDDYMLILSADDFLLPGALARATAVLDAHPQVGLVHGTFLDYRTGDPLPAPSGDSAEAELLEAAWLVRRLAKGNHIGTATAVVRSATQKELGHYRLDLPHSGDLEMWLRFALHSRVAFIAQPQAAYRRHAENLSTAYGRLADLEQCTAAFFANHGDIRRCLPNGTLVEAQIRRRFARRERKVARYLLSHGETRKGLRLFAQSLRNTAGALVPEFGARFGLLPRLLD